MKINVFFRLYEFYRHGGQSRKQSASLAMRAFQNDFYY